ncbi:MAG: hypothetical protein V4857_12845 [Pseudomonadota bacterium]
MRRRNFIASSAAVALGLQANVAISRTLPTGVTIVHGNKPSLGWAFGIKDLKKYLALAGLAPAVKTMSSARSLPQGTLVVLLDRSDPLLAHLRGRYPANAQPTGRESFSIFSYDRIGQPGSVVHFLEAADGLGEQFCCYEFLEQYAGTRFLHPDFEHTPKLTVAPKRINIAAVEPGFTHRGIYPWNYNYDRRGLTTFCDINARFEAQDWAWFARLGDWLVKNKQNTIFWFDDVFDGSALSTRFPESLKKHWRERGLRQVLGMGWAANEGRPRGGKWEALTCLDEHGRSAENADWRKAVCPQVDEYFALADKNIAELDFKSPDAIGALIGYGENTWAAHQTGSKCVRHASIASDTLMVRDLHYVSKKIKEAGAPDLPVGFVISTHSAAKDSPFIIGNIIKSLPANGMVSVHTYQQDDWTHFSDIFANIRQRNIKENTRIKVVQIAEIAFLCNYDIPLFRPAILRRREAHMRSLPREDTVGHLVTLNTTQYLYWLKSYQLMRWQWRIEDMSWGEDLTALGGHLFGGENRGAFGELMARFTALDLMQPQRAMDALMGSTTQLQRLPAWTRYTPKFHSDEFGFFLWAKGQTPEALDDAEQNVDACLKLNEQLAAAGGELYRNQFFDTLALTAHYHAIRIYAGKADNALTAARACEEWSACTGQLQQALKEIQRMKAAVQSYDGHLSKLVKNATSHEVTRKSVIADFVRNPSTAFLDERSGLIMNAIKNKSAPPALFST